MDALGIPRNGEIVTEADDNSLHVRFYVQAVQHGVKSTQAGRPIFEDKDFIEIRIPGDRNTVITREATEEDLARFPRAFSRFKAGKGEAIVGTPVEHWGILTPSQIAECKALNMPTVELLASVSDGNLGKMMGFRELRDKARTFVAASKDRGEVAVMQQQLAERDDKITSLEDKLATLSAAVEAMRAAAPEAEAAAQRVKRAPKAPAQPELAA